MNIKFGKIKDGALMAAPKTLRKDGKVHYNPSEELYREEGYLPVADTPSPEVSEGEAPKHYTSHYEEIDGKIVKVWSETEPPEVTEAEPTAEDKLAALYSRVEANEAQTEQNTADVAYIAMMSGIDIYEEA